MREGDLRLRRAVVAQFQRRQPQRRVGKVRPHLRLDQINRHTGFAFGLRVSFHRTQGSRKLGALHHARHRPARRLVCVHWPRSAAARPAGRLLETIAAHTVGVQAGLCRTSAAATEPATEAQAASVQTPPALPAIRHAAAVVDHVFRPSERAHCAELVVDRRVNVRRVMPLLPPEEHARARAEFVLDVGHRFVVRGQRDLAGDRFACHVRSSDPHRALLAGPVLGLVCFDLDCQQPLDWRDEEFLCFVVYSPVADQRRLDEEVRYVLGLDRHVDHRRTRRDVDETVVEQRAAADVVAEEDSRVVLCYIHEQVGRLANLVRPLVGDDLQVVEAIDAPVEFRTGGPEYRVAEYFLAPRILRLESDAELPLAGDRIAQRQPPLHVRFCLPAFDHLFADLAVVRSAITDAVYDHFTLGRDRHVVGGQRADVYVRLVLRLIPPAVGLDEREELLPSDDHTALSLDRPPALVADFDLDGVAMVAVGLLLFGPRRVDLQFVGPVGLQLRGALGDQLAQCVPPAAFHPVTPIALSITVVAPWEVVHGLTHPRPRIARPPAVTAEEAAPTPPPRQPWIGIVIPPVAFAVEPVVFARPPIHVLILLAEDLVGDLAAGDRGSEIVPGRNAGLDLLAQPGLRFGRFDRHLELGLLVFLHAEQPAGVSPRVRVVVVDPQVPYTQRRLFVERKLAAGAAVFVRLEIELLHLVVTGVVDFDVDVLVGPRCLVGTLAEFSLPNTKLDGLSRPINRPISDHIVARPLLPVVSGIVLGPVLEERERHAPALADDHGIDLRASLCLFSGVLDHAVLIRCLDRRCPMQRVLAVLPHGPMLVNADGLVGQRLARAGVGHVDQSLFDRVLLDDGDVGHKHEDARDIIPPGRPGLDQIGAGFGQRCSCAALGGAIPVEPIHRLGPRRNLFSRVQFPPLLLEEVPGDVAVIPVSVALVLHTVLDVFDEIDGIRLQFDFLRISVRER